MKFDEIVRYGAEVAPTPSPLSLARERGSKKPLSRAQGEGLGVRDSCSANIEVLR
jgi:hypothetical protein